MQAPSDAKSGRGLEERDAAAIGRSLTAFLREATPELPGQPRPALDVPVSH